MPHSQSALYAHLWQYVCPWDTLVLQFLHELVGLISTPGHFEWGETCT